MTTVELTAIHKHSCWRTYNVGEVIRQLYSIALVFMLFFNLAGLGLDFSTCPLFGQPSIRPYIIQFSSNSPFKIPFLFEPGVFL